MYEFSESISFFFIIFISIINYDMLVIVYWYQPNLIKDHLEKNLGVEWRDRGFWAYFIYVPGIWKMGFSSFFFKFRFFYEEVIWVSFGFGAWSFFALKFWSLQLNGREKLSKWWAGTSVFIDGRLAWQPRFRGWGENRWYFVSIYVIINYYFFNNYKFFINKWQSLNINNLKIAIHMLSKKNSQFTYHHFFL